MSTAPATTALINYDEEFAKIAEETRHSLAPTKGNHISTKGKLFTFVVITESQVVQTQDWDALKTLCHGL